MKIIGQNVPRSVEDWAGLTKLLSTPSALTYHCTLPAAQRAENAENAYLFAGFAAGAVRRRMTHLLLHATPALPEARFVPGLLRSGDLQQSDIDAMRLLPNEGDQFLYFTAGALVRERQNYQGTLEEQYLTLKAQRGGEEPYDVEELVEHLRRSNDMRFRYPNSPDRRPPPLREIVLRLFQQVFASHP